MATTSPPTTPAPAPAPAPVAAPKPGYLTSEAWLTALAMFLGYLPSSGLLANDPPAVVKAVGLISSVLAALGYTTNRTNLKRALTRVGSSAALIITLGLGLGVTLAATPGCATAKAVGTCELTTLEQGSNGSTLLAQVEADLLSAQYLAALETTAAPAGEAAVTCVLQAIEAFTAAELGLGSGSGATPAPAAISRTQLLHDNAVAALKARSK